MWLSLVKKILVTINRDRVKCLICGIYPSYVAGILKHGVEINFYVLCNDELRHSEYVEKAISSELCINYFVREYFTLSSSDETVLLKFETRMMKGELHSVLTFT
jgi:hypothetical protein